MKLITIRGKKDGGKTTTAALVNNKLVRKYNAKTVGFWMDKRLAPVNGDNGETHDFHSVLELNGKIIAIISAGDDAPYLKDELQKMIEWFAPDIMVVCARFRDDNFTMRMLQHDYHELYLHRKQVVLQYVKEKEKKNIMEKKDEEAEKCVNLILQLLN